MFEDFIIKSMITTTMYVEGVQIREIHYSWNVQQSLIEKLKHS